MPVHVEGDGRTTVLIVDDAPLNLLSTGLRSALKVALEQVAESGVERVVITGAGSAFIAGANAKEFDTPPQAPQLPEILDLLERLPMPSIAAINGAALGGGLEIALACRYRIASAAATVGLPETVLGVVPGSGGTQRLPRLVGAAAALDLIPLGRVLKAEAAQSIGLVDELAEDPVAAAKAVPLDTLMVRPPLSQRERPDQDNAAVEAARKLACRRMPGQTAPQRAIDLIEASSRLDWTEAVTREREMFLILRGSAEAKALRHVFFAERAAMSRLRTSAQDGPDVTCAVVVGGGNMGSAIAYALARADITVTLVEADEGGAERARGNVRRLVEQSVARGQSSAQQGAVIAEHISVAVGYDKLPAAQLAIEAVVEDMPAKLAVFAALETALPPDTILATNTSYLDIDRIATQVANPRRVVGLHFFSPAHVMRLLEIVRAESTGPDTLATSFRLAKRLDKIPVIAGVCDGFIGNRVLSRYRRQTNELLLKGATPREIDAAMREFGYPMGPYEVQDLSGLDISYANRRRLRTEGHLTTQHPDIGDTLVERMGRLGRKTSHGWYDYAEDGRQSVSAEVEATVLEASRQAGIIRSAIPGDDIRQRALAAMVAEACDILDEGIAARPSDIDLVLIHGYGFPRWRGGLMYFASTVSPAEWIDRFAELAREDPTEWRVPSLLERLARDGKTFADLNG